MGLHDWIAVGTEREQIDVHAKPIYKSWTIGISVVQTGSDRRDANLHLCFLVCSKK